MSTLNYARSRRRRMSVAAVASTDRARNFLRAVRAWHEARAAARHVHALTDHQLKDIGMNRGQVEWVDRDGAIPRSRRSHADD
jgi:uncharacterized protein YjiS (DUF1127 family)